MKKLFVDFDILDNIHLYYIFYNIRLFLTSIYWIYKIYIEYKFVLHEPHLKDYEFNSFDRKA